MTVRTTAGFLLVMAATAACGAEADGPPRVEVDRSACAHCGMLISEPRFAAAYRAPGSDARLFDDVGCLLEGLSRESDRSGVHFWFHEVTTAEWIEGDRAVFVESAHLRTPMGSGIVAYASDAAAARGAAAHNGRRIGGVEELVNEPRKGGVR